MKKEPDFNTKAYLLDIFALTLTAFGGPQAHLAMMLDKLAIKKKYITEAEILELNAFCQFLPGPSSTQTLTAIGYKLGKQKLALLTLLIWVSPAALGLTLIVFLYAYLESFQIDFSFLRFIEPLAIGFVLAAAIRLLKSTMISQVSWLVMMLSLTITLAIPSPYVFPAVLLLGGLITNFSQRGPMDRVKLRARIKWNNLIIFFGVFLASATIGFITKEKSFLLFENTFRYGSLVFGGGQVLVPMMYEQFVEYKRYLTSEQFLTGFGLVSAMPGPVFSFSTFIGAMTLRDQGTLGILLGATIGTVGIFLPGALLIFFLLPIWNGLRQLSIVKRSLEGANAASTGLVVSAVFILGNTITIDFLNVLIVLCTALSIIYFKAPPLLLVFIGLFGGFLAL